MCELEAVDKLPLVQPKSMFRCKDSTSAGKGLPAIMHRSNNEEGTLPVVGI